MDLYVTVAQLKAHLRIDSDSDSEDLLLAQYIESAQEEAETRMRRPICSATDTDAVASTPENIPASIRQFILVTAGDFYMARENRQEKGYTLYYEHLLDRWVRYDK